MRVFVAIDFPDNIKDAIWYIIEQLQTKEYMVKFTKKELLHITLKFLGEQPDHNLSNLLTRIDKIAKKSKKFLINLNTCGVFKNTHLPRILWIGENKNNNFDNIASQMDIFSTKENHVCHVTLGRIKNLQPDKAKQLIADTQNLLRQFDFSFTVSQFSLIKSTLSATSPIYTKLVKFQLQD